MNKIKIKRGNSATLPVLEDGELAFLKDSGRLIVNSNGSNFEVGTVNLAHSKTGKTHNLSGTIPQSGIVSAQSKATADYNDGDSITVNGQPYTLLQGSFKANIPMAMLVDVGAKTVTVGGSGGGGGKGMQQVELPMSLIYEDTSSEKTWGTMNVDGQPDMAGGCYDENTGILYSTKNETVDGVSKTVLYKQNYATKNVSRIVFPLDSYLISPYCKLFIYDGELYAFYALQPSGQTKIYGYTYKFNQNTKTITMVKWWEITSSAANDGVSNSFFARVNETTIAAIVFRKRAGTDEYYGFYTAFDFLTNNVYVSSSDVVFSNAGVGDSRFVQLSNTKCYMGIPIFSKVGQIYTTGCAVLEIDINKPFADPKYVKSIENFESFFTSTESVQIGSKLMYISSTLLSGKHTGEIDLTTGNIDPTKYPDCPAGVNASLFNMQLIGNEVIAQNTGKTFSLKLVPVKPESKPPVLYLDKGDKYSAPFIPTEKSINVLALTNPVQSAFTITNMPQVATEDKEIHMSQYDLQGSPTQILIKKG